MKIVSLVLLATAAHGFAPAARPYSFVTVSRRMSETSTTEPASDFASAMPDAAADPYERLGVADKDKVAMGMDVNEILQWLGT